MQSDAVASSDEEICSRIELAFGASGANGTSAMQFCTSLKQSASALPLCLRLLSKSCSDAVTFFCLDVILQNVSKAKCCDSDRRTLRSHLLVYCRDVYGLHPRAPFVRNKLALVLVTIAEQEFPHLWPAFFQDLIALLPNGPPAVDLFVRVLGSVHEEIIIGSERSMTVKDALRDGDIGTIVSVLYEVITASATALPALADSALRTLALYIPWIDISLVANARYFNLLYELMDLPNELSDAACLVVSVIAQKSMPSHSSIQLLKESRIVERVCACPTMSAGVARLTHAVGLALLRAVENSPENEEVDVMLLSLLPLCAKALQQDDVSHVRSEALDLLGCILPRVRKLGVESRVHQSYAGSLPLLLAAFVRALELPAWFTPCSEDDAELELNAFRSRVLSLFQNHARLFPVECAMFVSSSLSAASSGPTLEALLQLLMELEPKSGRGSSTPSPALKQTVSSVLRKSSTMDIHSRLVCIQLSLRYSDAVVSPEHVEDVLALFLGSGGLLLLPPQYERVRARASQLFVRVLKRVLSKAALQSHLEDLCTALQGIISTYFCSSSYTALSDELRNVCESVGFLLAQFPTVDRFQLAFERVLQPLLHVLDASVAQGCSASTFVSASVATDSLSALCKPLSSCKLVQPALSSALAQVLERVQRVPVAPSPRFRGALVQFLRRLFVSAGVDSLSFTAPLLSTLLTTSADGDDLEALLSLLCHCVSLFRDAASATLNDLWCDVVQALYRVLDASSYVDTPPEQDAGVAYTAEKLRRATLLKAFFLLLSQMASKDCCAVFLRHQQHLPVVLDLVVRGVFEVEDVGCNRTCVGILKHLVSHDWESLSSATQNAMFGLCARCLSPLTHSRPLRDVKSLNLLKELVDLARLLQSQNASPIGLEGCLQFCPSVPSSTLQAALQPAADPQGLYNIVLGMYELHSAT